MTMNALTIKDPADLLSFIGHTLGFWPQGSLACITLNAGYRFARLTDHMLGAGIIAGWNTNKNTASKTNLDMP
jgi:hypothetical protein